MDEKTKRVFYLSVIVILVGVFLVLPVVGECQQQKPIKIGSLFPKIGALAYHGTSAEQGALMAVEEFNAQGGILGRKIEYVWREPELKAEVALRNANALIYESKVDYILGPMTTLEATAITDLCREQKVPLFSTALSIFLCEEKGHRYFFRVSPDSWMIAGAQANYIKDVGFRTCWTVAPDYAYGHATMKDKLSRLEEFNVPLKLLGQSWPPLAEKDFSAYIAQIVTANPNIVFLDLFAGQLLSFLKQAKGYGLYDKVQISLDGQPEQIRAFGLDMKEGLMGWTTYDITAPKSASNDEWIKRYQKRWGGDAYPGYSSAQFYTAMVAIKAAMEAAGTTTDKEAIINKLETIKFQAPIGEVYFRALDHQIAWPIPVGRTVFLPGFKFAVIGKDVKIIPAEKIWRTEEQVKDARAKKK